MSKSSDAVRKWRNNTKARIVEAMGGACCICGYNKCHAALALHHLDPSKKDLSFGAIRANPKKWAKIVDELRKCVLVCHNCHTEVHNGLATVPDDAPGFNPEFQEYRLGLAMLEPCPMCGAPKPLHNKYCSLSCSSRSLYRVAWDDVDLEHELKTKSQSKIAEELGCSEAAVRKRLKKIRSGNKNTIKSAQPSVELNCFACGKTIRVYHSALSSRNFCSRKCSDGVLYNEGWPTDEELRKMRTTLSAQEMSIKLNKSLSATYNRLRRIK